MSSDASVLDLEESVAPVIQENTEVSSVRMPHEDLQHSLNDWSAGFDSLIKQHSGNPGIVAQLTKMNRRVEEARELLRSSDPKDQALGIFRASKIEDWRVLKQLNQDDFEYEEKAIQRDLELGQKGFKIKGFREDEKYFLKN